MRAALGLESDTESTARTDEPGDADSPPALSPPALSPLAMPADRQNPKRRRRPPFPRHRPAAEPPSRSDQSSAARPDVRRRGGP
ncbi:MAG: hypothetical protein QOE97_2069 [Pseudonocardiales bacterium]|nr:hypothetical protein [Pseudonocardiales bacterium]